jgi:hypothetical protein
MVWLSEFFIVLLKEAHCITQAGLKLWILLPQPLSAGIIGIYYYFQLFLVLLNTENFKSAVEIF